MRADTTELCAVSSAAPVVAGQVLSCDTELVVEAAARLRRPLLADDAPEWERPAIIWLDDDSPWRPRCSVRRFWELYEHAAERGMLLGGWLAPARVSLIGAKPMGEMTVYHPAGADPADLVQAFRYIDATARHMAAGERVVYHGTTAPRATRIKRSGLVSLPPADAYNPSGPGPFVADSPRLAFLFGCRAAARELLPLDQLRVLPPNVPVSVLAIQIRASNLIPVGTDEYRARGLIAPEDVLGEHVIDARGWLESISPEERITEYTNSSLFLVDSTPHAALPGIPDLRALVDVTVKGRGGMGNAHGLAHAVQVADFGLQLSGPGVDGEIVLAFALLHDAAREDDGRDPGHGARAADLARGLEQTGVLCFGGRLALLCGALSGHEHGERSDDPTVAVCWDADRLALRRFGVEPDPDLLSSRAAREMAARGLEMSAMEWPEIAAGYVERFGMSRPPGRPKRARTRGCIGE